MAKHKKEEEEEDKNNCDPGCDNGCDACDACDSCGGCDLFLTLSTLVMLVATVAGAADRVRGRAPLGRRRTPRGGDAAAGFALVAIRAYQRWVSPRLSARCRYTPTCSAFAASAIAQHGLAVGARLAAERLRRCQRSVPHGTLDPVSSLGR